MQASKPSTGETSITLYRQLGCKGQLDINLFFVGFNLNISYFNTLKMQKEVSVLD